MIAAGSCGCHHLRVYNRRIATVIYSFGKHIHDFVLISELCVAIQQQYIIDCTLNLIRIDEIIIVRSDCHIFQFTVAEEDDY